MIDTIDHGTPVKTATAIVAGKAVNFEWAAYNSRSLMGHTVPQSPNELAYLQHEPIGVCA